MAADDTQLAEWKDRFRKTPLARTVVAALEGRAPEIWRRTFDLLRRDSPEYRNAVDDEFTAESKSHCGELLQAIIAIAGGRLKGSDPFGFVRRHAEWRASHHVPLVASLHAYRLAHKTYWTVTREALSANARRKDALAAIAMLSEFWIELFEAVGSVLEEAHAAEEARMGAQNTPVYSTLIDELLRGIEPSDPEARRVQALCGIRPGLQLAVAIVRPLPVDNGKQVDAEVAVRSLARLVQQSLPPAFGRLVARRGGEVVAIVSSDRDPASRLVKALGPRFNACAGVSLDKTEVERLPAGAAEARIALEFASAKRPLVCFAGIELTEFLIRRADKAALRLIPDWTREAHSAHGRNGDLFRTIRAFAECSLNVKQTARRLGVHTNTVYFRLNQIKKRSGVDPRTFAGASYLLAALDLLDVHS